jgi:CheY-like chemotaxis protein/two-component sensor histidine kinase
MTHELRTPLVGVLGMNELLIESRLDAGQYALAESVQRSGQELLELINDILDFSKIEAGHLKLERLEVDLLQLVEEVVSILADRAYNKGIEFLCRVEPSAARTVEADPQRLRQILFNLLGNALKFTQRGAVSLALTRDAEGQFVFAVEDTGIGMDLEAQRIIFNAFSQVDDSTSRVYGGTGLGLSIVRDLTHMMNGQLSLQSEPGQGSIFTVKLPLKDLDFSLISFPASSTGVTVILLDSNQDSRESLLRRLLDLGFEAEGVDSMAALVHKCHGTGENDGFDFALLVEGSFAETAEFVTSVKNYCRTTICLRKKFSTSFEQTWDVDLLQPLLWSHLCREETFCRGGRPAAGSLEPLAAVDACPAQDPAFLGWILIVDDNASTRELIGFSLVGSGWKNAEARTAAEAFELVKNQEYQLILMDINMPGMDGFAATRQLRQQGLDTPIFALTAHGDAGTMENCLAVGMQGFLRKPFRQGELFRILDQYGLRTTIPPDSVPEGA